MENILKIPISRIILAKEFFFLSLCIFKYANALIFSSHKEKYCLKIGEKNKLSFILEIIKL